MENTLAVAFKIVVVIFMAGNLLDMGLRLDLKDAVRGLRNWRFVAHTLLWGFVLCPALAWGLTRVLPLDPAYGLGLILIGIAPCAPFLPMLVEKGNGDLGYTAAFMLLTAVGSVVFMPLAVPVLAEGLSVSAWTIAKPLLVVIWVPLAAGMAVLRASAPFAAKFQPVVKKITTVATVGTLVLMAVIYGKGVLGVAGTLAVASQVIFYLLVAVLTYWLGFGLQQGQKVVLSAGMVTRNLGAAFAPLLSAADVDQRATVMVVLGLPLMVVFAKLAVRWFGRPASQDALASPAPLARTG